MAKVDELAKSLAEAHREQAKAKRSINECQTAAADACRRYDDLQAHIKALLEQMNGAAKEEAEQSAEVPVVPVRER